MKVGSERKFASSEVARDSGCRRDPLFPRVRILRRPPQIPSTDRGIWPQNNPIDRCDLPLLAQNNPIDRLDSSLKRNTIVNGHLVSSVILPRSKVFFVANFASGPPSRWRRRYRASLPTRRYPEVPAVAPDPPRRSKSILFKRILIKNR